MHAPDMEELLASLSAGEQDALEPMAQMLYRELRGLAQRQLRRDRASVQPTSLVHEAYMRLVKKPDLDWGNRRHFYFAAARAMRDIVIERARRAGALKRGGDRPALSLDHGEIALQDQASELLELNSALDELKLNDEHAAEVVMLRFFSGLTGEETAAALGVSPSTVDRRWSYAKAWLHRRLERPS